MTEQPPETTEETPPPPPGSPSPTNAEQGASATQQETQSQTPLKPSDHVTYSQQLYKQPNFVVQSVFHSGRLDPNGGPYTQAQVQQAIDAMMHEPDKRYQQ